MNFFNFVIAILFGLTGILHFIGGTFRYARVVDFNNKLLLNRQFPVGPHEVLAIAQLTVGVILIILSIYVWNW